MTRGGESLEETRRVRCIRDGARAGNEGGVWGVQGMEGVRCEWSPLRGGRERGE